MIVMHQLSHPRRFPSPIQRQVTQQVTQRATILLPATPISHLSLQLLIPVLLVLRSMGATPALFLTLFLESRKVTTAILLQDLIPVLLVLRSMEATPALFLTLFLESRKVTTAILLQDLIPVLLVLRSMGAIQSQHLLPRITRLALILCQIMMPLILLLAAINRLLKLTVNLALLSPNPRPSLGPSLIHPSPSLLAVNTTSPRLNHLSLNLR
jgi:hypothetical protein